MVVDLDGEAHRDLVLHALADRTRRDIVGSTLHQPRSVSALARRYPMSVTAVQKHVAVLERAGLITKRRQGREQLVQADIGAVRVARAALDELEGLWRGRVERMVDLLADPAPHTPDASNPTDPESRRRRGPDPTETP